MGKLMPRVPVEFGKRYVLVEFTENGAEYTPVGFVGGACRLATQPFQDALGGKTISSEDRKSDTNDVVVNN